MKNSPIKVSASIVCANWMNLEYDLRLLEDEQIDYIHYDVMDGFFCPDYCLGTQVIDIIRRNTKIPSHYHLMVEEPARILNNFKPEANSIMSIHYEACRNLHRDLVRIKQMGFRVGVVLNPGTSLDAIEYVVEEVDVVGVMTVNPGYAGQKLVPQTIKKIEKLCEWRRKDKLKFEICVDGNVNAENIPQMVAAGSDILVGGSSGLFVKGVSLKDSIERMRRDIQAGLRNRK